MKNIILLLLLNFCLFSCYSQKTNSEIVYFLPSTVRVKILEKLKTINDSDKTSFVLGNDEFGNYIIYINSTKESKFWVENTNRVLFLDGKFYPLIFETDEYFSYPESKTLIMEKMAKEEGIRKITTIRDNVFSVKFTINGEIIN
ncbi:hypothetical protein [Chryseobacterium shigense]|uniref:Beta-lactamase-inhibitor-like, PepSY-like n=1 Tax=Chryseobacterium shigense TaxID=297244 RepID=A0A841NK05_9FLAO|nr:hypothetical protein [Chryseobacterium shigense]MBB6372392.1 hypothetical protein [Chryseobacterium shigense]